MKPWGTLKFNTAEVMSVDKQQRQERVKGGGPESVEGRWGSTRRVSVGHIKLFDDPCTVWQAVNRCGHGYLYSWSWKDVAPSLHSLHLAASTPCVFASSRRWPKTLPNHLTSTVLYKLAVWVFPSSDFQVWLRSITAVFREYLNVTTVPYERNQM